MERATAFSWDLAVPRAVLLSEVEAIAGRRPFAELAGTAEEATLLHRLAESARVTLGSSAIIWERSREIGALVAVNGARHVAGGGRGLPAGSGATAAGRGRQRGHRSRRAVTPWSSTARTPRRAGH